MRPLIENGHLYVAIPPLFGVKHGKGFNELMYFWKKEETTKFVNTLGNSKYEIKRYKGLGEMQPAQIEEILLNKEKRILKKMTLEDAGRANLILTKLMGIDTSSRKHLLLHGRLDGID